MANATTSPGSYKGVSIAPGDDAAVQSQVRAIDAGAAPSPASAGAPRSGGGRTPSPGAVADAKHNIDRGRGSKKDYSVINSGNLAPSAPATLPDAPTPTRAAGVIASVDQQAKDYASTVVADRALADAKAKKDRSYDELYGRYADRKGISALTSEEYAASVDPAKTELDQINAEILAEQTSARRRVERIRENPRGATAEALEQEVRAVERESAAILADKSVIQYARQNNYYGAKEAADRKIAAVLEQDQQDLELLQFAYNENKGLFDKQEQRQFEAAQSERARLLSERADNMKQVSNIAIEYLQNGGDRATADRILKSEDPAQAIGLAGNVLGSLDRQLKQAQLATEYQKVAAAKAAAEAAANGTASLSFEDNARLNSTPQAKAINDGARFAAALKEYRSKIEKYGGGEVFGRGSGEINSAYQTVVASVKDYYQLGTLDNGVEKLVALGIPKPSVWSFDKARIAAIDEQLKGVSNDLSRNAQQLATTGYANSVEGKQLLYTADEVAGEYRYRQMGNEDFLSSIPYGEGVTIDNGAFFNAY